MRPWSTRISRLTNDEGEPCTLADLAPFYSRVEKPLTVRERGVWGKSVYTAQAGFKALGTDLEPVMFYTDARHVS